MEKFAKIFGKMALILHEKIYDFFGRAHLFIKFHHVGIAVANINVNNGQVDWSSQ